jgi:hypothetical protein
LPDKRNRHRQVSVVEMLICTMASFGVPDTLLMTKVSELLDVNVFAAVAFVVAGVELLTVTALSPVTLVPPIFTAKTKDGEPEPLV